MAFGKAPFRSTRAGVQVNLDDQEREILVHLLGQLHDLLDDGRSDEEVDPLEALVGMRAPADGGPPAPPDDPAVARLLPDGNRDDPEAASEYRRLTEYGLRSRKREGARTAAAALNRPAPVVLTAPEALSLLKAFTDVRLVLGERLELKTDEDAESLHERLWAGEEPESWLATASIYEVLTAWQEHLVTAVSKQR
ncbi:DUF2017 domain-containing protein [Kineosporia rhizophila]|uniref:DUF2017 family protein n=1 Tax=Kineosporia TaxID=49184 RepID=UPI001E2B7484|nr:MULTISPECIES: DUF2017 family protein [Kineosporia]MCE0534744.1 DUF2017 domain-containing protein [Kineosporia rhizophila]GLY19330.1 hypothetical protein Kisp01_63440 [Kineosporia sp. NBRC 101677]